MLLICLVRWCPYCFLTSRLVPKIMADDLVIMVGRNHIFVEDQMTRRGDLWLNRKKYYSFKCGLLILCLFSLCVLSESQAMTYCQHPYNHPLQMAVFRLSQPDSQTNITSENAHGNDAWMDRNPAADGFFVLLQQHITHTRWGKGLWGPRASMDIDCFPKALPRPWTLHPGRKGWSNPHTTRRGRAATIKVKDVV